MLGEVQESLPGSQSAVKSQDFGANLIPTLGRDCPPSDCGFLSLCGTQFQLDWFLRMHLRLQLFGFRSQGFLYQSSHKP